MVGVDSIVRRIVTTQTSQAQQPKRDAEKRFRRRSRVIQSFNVPLRVRLNSSFAAALPEGLFAHPASGAESLGSVLREE